MNKVISVSNGVAVIEGTNGGFFTIDQEDLQRVLALGSWSQMPNGYWRHNRSVYLGNNKYKQKTVLLHRFVLHEEDTQSRVDHFDGNKSNCCKSNLRVASGILNALNKNISSDFIGVRKSSKNTFEVVFRGTSGRKSFSTKNVILAAALYDLWAFEEDPFTEKHNNFATKRYTSKQLKQEVGVSSFKDITPEILEKDKNKPILAEGKTSEFSGVSFDTRSGKWKACVSVISETTGKSISKSLGVFSSPLEAAKAREAWLVNHPMNKSRRNFLYD